MTPPKTRDKVVRELHEMLVAGARCGYRHHRSGLGTAWDGDEGVPWCGLEESLAEAYDAGLAAGREAERKDVLADVARVGLDWREDGQMAKVDACDYLYSRIETGDHQRE